MTTAEVVHGILLKYSNGEEICCGLDELEEEIQLLVEGIERSAEESKQQLENWLFLTRQQEKNRSFLSKLFE